ncbi:MAG: radical SAM protein [Desulfobulbaceae bacterium]|uniref:Radical SAM protein n=1 Tax=Candidatus Desulfatifera sulfidica TaxID=2841691 RepID=A0A8J6TD32_9BACT|nr:radical SAM protein [Candidatus Desulfatifera sulfidica]
MIPTTRTVGFQSGERNVFFHILTACNLSCQHCYINPAQHGTKTLDRETMAAWIELFARPGTPSNLIFLGGEPTMHPDLAFGIERAKDLGFAVTVDSNGYLFHDLLERTSPDLLDYLSFSLDGPDAAVNDPLRGEGVFEVCTTNLRRAVAMGYGVSVIYTVSSRNIDHLERMIPLLDELGVRRFFIQVIGLRGKSAQDSQEAVGGWQVDPGHWLRVVPEVARAAAARGIHVTFPKVFLDPGETFECAGLAADNYFIFPNGRVYRCPLCEDYPINAYRIEQNRLVKNHGLMEDSFFPLQIPEGCVMNRLLQPDNIVYDQKGRPEHCISCCLLKQEICPWV